MGTSDFELVFQALQASGVRYLVVGGVVVVLHGHPRFTADLDLVVALQTDNARAAIVALSGLGYGRRPPVDPLAFADPVVRKAWIAEEDMTVLSLWSPEHPGTEVDLFVREPLDFEGAAARAVVVDLGGVRVPVASIEDLISIPSSRSAAVGDAPRAGIGWAAHEREQRLAWLQLTPRQRLDWLWQAKTFARRVEEARRRAEPGGTGPAISPDPLGPGWRTAR